MHRLSKALLVVAALLALTARAEETPAPGPGPEMLRLQKLYLGTWDYTESYPKMHAANTGVYSSELGPGGNSLVNRFHSKGPVGDFEGMIVLTWDPKEKIYKAYIFGADFPGNLVQTGQFEGDALVFRGQMEMGPKKLSTRNSTHIDEKGTLIAEQYMAANGGPESLFVKVEAKRRP